MAIDTHDKRRSVSGYTSNPIYPVADGTIGLQDRPHIAWLYRGITIASVSPVVDSWTLLARSLGWTIDSRDVTWELLTRGTAWTVEDR